MTFNHWWVYSNPPFCIFSSQPILVYLPYSIYRSSTEPKWNTLPQNPSHYYFEKKFTRIISVFSVFSNSQWQNIFAKPFFQALGVSFPPQSMLQSWSLWLNCTCSSTLTAGERKLCNLWVFDSSAKIFSLIVGCNHITKFALNF